MSDAASVYEPLGFGLTNSGVIIAAFVGFASGALSLTAKMLYDAWSFRRRRKDQKEGADHRQTHERDLATSRENFERTEREARQKFEMRLSKDLAEREQRLQDYVLSQEWQLKLWSETKDSIEKMRRHLKATTSRLDAVVKCGGFLKNVEMIKQTAQVLDVFGDFQSSVEERPLPWWIQEQAGALVRSITVLLISLSPVQDKRADPTRQELLDGMWVERQKECDDFLELCALFERDPLRFEKVSRRLARRDRARSNRKNAAMVNLSAAGAVQTEIKEGAENDRSS